MIETQQSAVTTGIPVGVTANECALKLSGALRRGETHAALEAARPCLAEPNRAEAHDAFGQAWMASGKPARAQEAFAIAAELRPGFADAWVNFGLPRFALGAVSDAKARALQAQPDHTL